MNDFWSFCLNQLQQELPPQQFNTWIRPLRIESGKSGNDADGGLRIFASNDFVLKLVRDLYLARIKELGDAYFSAPITVSLFISKPLQVAEPTITEKPVKPDLQAGLDSHYKDTRLNPGFTFENLIVGKANDFAKAASVQVASSPGTMEHNPLFIYGGTGLGKTHIIHAIGNRILEKNWKTLVRYVHADDYISDVVNASLRSSTNPGSINDFKRRYHSLDVLLLDDIQFLGYGNKSRTREEFFSLFNILIEAKKQIIITCDTYPKDINGLEDRLVTRFDWGLTVQIEPPEIEMRVAILKKKAEMENVDLDNDVAFYIARHLRSNVRELEGALKRVLAYSSFHGRKIDLELTKESLKDIIGTVSHQITVDGIQKTVADYFKIKLTDLFSAKRNRQIVRPRQIAMWLAKNLTSQSYPSIGEAFGGRDHTTVLHAIRTIEALRVKDSELNHDIHFLTQVLKG